MRIPFDQLTTTQRYILAGAERQHLRRHCYHRTFASTELRQAASRTLNALKVRCGALCFDFSSSEYQNFCRGLSERDRQMNSSADFSARVARLPAGAADPNAFPLPDPTTHVTI